jgi:hypothetical protein
MSTETETKLKNTLLNKELTHIEFYNASEKFWVFDEEKIWVLDLGIQLTFGEEIVTFGWDKEKQFYDVHYGKIEDVTRDLKMMNLEAENVEGIKALIGQKITDAKFQWNFYQDLDENYEPNEEKNYMPMEMILTFSNGSILQLATIEFHVNKETKMIEEPTFDSTAQFLVTLNHYVEVKEQVGSMDDEELI